MVPLDCKRAEGEGRADMDSTSGMAADPAGYPQDKDADASRPKTSSRQAPSREHVPRDPYVRAENEDDDGYDPYSDRRPEPEPLFERDPWA